MNNEIIKRKEKLISDLHVAYIGMHKKKSKYEVKTEIILKKDKKNNISGKYKLNLDPAKKRKSFDQ